MSTPKPRAPRYQVRGLRIIYDTGEEFWSGPVVDVSESGLFVETHHELPAGTRVTIMPDLPEAQSLPFELRGVVVRSNEYDPADHWDRTPGIGFKLEGLSLDNFAQLRAFLKQFGVPVHAGNK